MKQRLTAAAVLVVLLALATASAAGAKLDAPTQGAEITVWLMSDAQTNWPEAVAAANQAFRQKNPGATVNVQYQSWGDYKTKFEATLAGGNAPDVIEFGNTDTPKYSAAGALAPLNKSQYPNSATWLSGLAKAGIYNGRTFAVPYYAGARGVIYRTDQYKAAGIKSTPKSLAEFMAAGNKLMATYGRSKDPTYSAVYYPGRYWHAAMSFVYDFGGQIAAFQGGKWVGTLDSPRAVTGLNAWKRMVLQLSKANKTGDENKPQQSQVFAKGKVGSIIANGWEWGAALDPKTGNPKLDGKIGAYPMPSHTSGKFMPTFLGGSVLGIPVTSRQKALAADWLAAFTSTANMTRMSVKGGVIPNTTRLASVHAKNPKLAPFARAATSSWFVPSTPNWANVESAGTLQALLSGILRNPGKTKQLAAQASDRIEQILNARS